MFALLWTLCPHFVDILNSPNLILFSQHNKWPWQRALLILISVWTSVWQFAYYWRAEWNKAYTTMAFNTITFFIRKNEIHELKESHEGILQLTENECRAIVGQTDWIIRPHWVVCNLNGHLSETRLKSLLRSHNSLYIPPEQSGLKRHSLLIMNMTTITSIQMTLFYENKKLQPHRRNIQR